MILAATQTDDRCAGDIGEADEPSVLEEQVAVHYIDGQVSKARRSLRRTRAFCLVIIASVFCYMSVVTIVIRNQILRPQAAAEVAAYYFSKFATQNGPALSQGFGGQPHELTAPVLTTPAMESPGNSGHPFQRPNPRTKSGSFRVETEVATYVQGFISHHGNVQDLLREAQHPKTVQELSTELDQEIRKRLPSQDSNGYPDAEYMSYLDQKLETLDQLELQLNRLAQNRDLTPYEKALRHVIASTMGNARSGS